MEIIGHRGQVKVGGPPENTLDAVQTALDAGAEGVEIDVRLTSDGVPVCLHDPDLRRLTGSEVLVHGATFAQLGGIPLAGGHRIPRMEDVLTLARGRGWIVLDVKHGAGPAGPLVHATLDAVSRSTDRRGLLRAGTRALAPTG